VSKRFNFRIGEELAETIERAPEGKSAFLRSAVRAYVNRSARIPSAEHLQALGRLTAELSAIGRNLNQIAKIANIAAKEQSGFPSGKAIKDEIAELRRHNKTIRAIVRYWSRS